jgi:hypothetical protein
LTKTVPGSPALRLISDARAEYITNRAPIIANGAPGQNKTAISSRRHQEKMMRPAAFLSSYRNETHLT